MTMQPVGGRLQREKRFWKILSIVEFFIILFMAYNTPVPQNRGGGGSSKSKLDKFTEYADAIKDKKPIFNPDSLKMIKTQANINLVREIQTNWLKPPSERPYNITPGPTTDLTAVRRLHKAVLKLFDGKQNGFFIECGAFDGVDLSNTLHLEQNYNWTGLLVEADPKYYNRLMTRQRKVWAINACLSIKPYEERVRMTRIKNADALSVISELADNSYRTDPQAEEFEAQCFPLTSILSALGQTLNIDYFSLDVEGAELSILKTVPWDFVYIKVISLEANAQRIGPILEFLATKNYEFYKSIQGAWINDHIFVHKQFIKARYALDKRSFYSED